MEDKSRGRKLPLPPGWRAVQSELGPYYWNQETNATQWRRPAQDTTYEAISDAATHKTRTVEGDKRVAPSAFSSVTAVDTTYEAMSDPGTHTTRTVEGDKRVAPSAFSSVALDTTYDTISDAGTHAAHVVVGDKSVAPNKSVTPNKSMAPPTFSSVALDTTYDTISDASTHAACPVVGDKTVAPSAFSSVAFAGKEEGENGRQTPPEHSIYEIDSEEGTSSNSPPPLPPRLYLSDDDDKSLAGQIPKNNTESNKSTSHSSSSPPPIPPRLYREDDEVLVSLSLVTEEDSHEDESLSSSPPPIPPRLYLDDDDEEHLADQLPETDVESLSPPPPIPPRMYLHDKDFISKHLQSINCAASSLSRISKPPVLERDNEVNLRRCASDPPPSFLAQRVLESNFFPPRNVPAKSMKPDLPNLVRTHPVFTSKEYFEESIQSSSPPRSSFSHPHVHVCSVDRSPPPLPSKKAWSDQLVTSTRVNFLSPLGPWTNLKGSGYRSNQCKLSRSMPSITSQGCVSDEEVITCQKLAKDVFVPPVSLPKPSAQFVSSMDDYFPPRLPPKPFLSEAFHKTTSRDQSSHPKTAAVLDCNVHRTKSSHCPTPSLVRQRQEEFTKKLLGPLPPPPVTHDQRDVGTSHMERHSRPLSAYSHSATTTRKIQSIGDSGQYLEELTGTLSAHAAAPADNEEISQVRRCYSSSFTEATYSLVGPSSPSELQGPLPTPFTASCSGVESLESIRARGSGHKSNPVASRYSLLDVPPPLPKKTERRLFGFKDNKRAFFGRAIHKKKSDSDLSHGSSKSCQLHSEKKSAVPFGDRVFTKLFKQGPRADNAKSQYDKLCHTTSVQRDDETLPGDVKETTYNHLIWQNTATPQSLSETAFKPGSPERGDGLKLLSGHNLETSLKTDSCSNRLGLLRKAQSSTSAGPRRRSEHELSANIPSCFLDVSTVKPSHGNGESGQQTLSSSSSKSRTWGGDGSEETPPLPPRRMHETTNHSRKEKSSKISKR